jgi:geranylgeranyl diphosphate synthase, type I
MSLEKLKEIKVKVEEELEKYFDDKINNTDYDISKEVFEFLKDYTLRGGKRIRVGMLVYGYGCFKEINKDIIKAAMVMELMQTYFLIHDDIMDKDDVRRGKDSMHIMYEKKYDFKDKKHFGASMAICAGDLAASLANEILLESNFEKKDEVVKVMNEILEKVCCGQMLDIVYGNKSIDELSEKDVMDV